jgi:predicted tellurium resistance membrane protein TerC
MTLDLVFTFLLLVGLELVLGIDNVLIISILSSRLPADRQESARRIGLSLAMLTRIAMLFGVTALQRLTTPVLYNFSIRDLILLAGGLFLIYKAVREIHHVVEGDSTTQVGAVKGVSFSSIIIQIILFDMVFSIDSIITAVGLTDHLWVIIAAVLFSFVLVLMFASAIANFVHAHPALKILALSFLVCIGVTLFMEGMHHEVPKAYIYLPMGFALAVELLQMRYLYKSKAHPAKS